MDHTSDITLTTGQQGFEVCIEHLIILWVLVYEKYQNFLSEHFQFLELKISIYWNRRVFVMVYVRSTNPLNSYQTGSNNYTSTDHIYCIYHDLLYACASSVDLLLLAVENAWHGFCYLICMYDVNYLLYLYGWFLPHLVTYFEKYIKTTMTRLWIKATQSVSKH